MHDTILYDDIGGGYSVSADQYPRKAEAARVLIEEEVGTPASWLGILRITRRLAGPTELFHHSPDGDEGCFCEEDWWVCSKGQGPPAGRYWYLEEGYGTLEDAAYVGLKEEDE